MNITAIPAFETISEKTARIVINTTVDGHTYSQVHISGPIKDVKAYFDGELSMKELKFRWAPKGDAINGAVSIVTAFSSYDELKQACREGYKPTIRVFSDDSHGVIRAKDLLTAQLKADGFEVFTS